MTYRTASARNHPQTKVQSQTHKKAQTGHNQKHTRRNHTQRTHRRTSPPGSYTRKQPTANITQHRHPKRHHVYLSHVLALATRQSPSTQRAKENYSADGTKTSSQRHSTGHCGSYDSMLLNADATCSLGHRRQDQRPNKVCGTERIDLVSQRNEKEDRELGRDPEHNISCEDSKKGAAHMFSTLGQR